MKSPKISVLMPVFNAEKYLAESIESILNQTFTNFEFLILDDGSTDGSRAIAERFADSRIRILVNEENKGLIFSRNRCLAEARADFLAWADADDISLPERLAEQYEQMSRNPSLVLLGSQIKLIDNKGVIKGKWNLPTRSREIRCELLFRNCFAQPSVMLRASVLKSMTYDPDFPLAEDYDLWQRLSEKYELANSEKVLLHYRQHENNISNRNELKLKTLAQKITGRQLLRLGARPDEDLADTHLKIANLVVEDRKKAEAHFDFLLRANRRHRLYPEPEFSDMLARYRREVYFQPASSFGKLSDWLRSPLSRRQGLLAYLRTAGRILWRMFF